jgi:hypothetical protein
MIRTFGSDGSEVRLKYWFAVEPSRQEPQSRATATLVEIGTRVPHGFERIDLASVNHVLSTTRAVRKRLDLRRPVEQEILKRWIEIATQAPTALYDGICYFVVVTEPAKREAIAASYQRTGNDCFSGRLSPVPFLARLRAQR